MRNELRGLLFATFLELSNLNFNFRNFPYMSELTQVKFDRKERCGLTSLSCVWRYCASFFFFLEENEKINIGLDLKNILNKEILKS